MKFGGTSVGDAACIERVAQIIQDGARTSRVAVVVSAMSGVTNKLMEAATRSAAGDSSGVATIFQELRQRHGEAADRLIATPAAHSTLALHMARLFQEGESRCQRAILAKKLTVQTRDAIASLGERLAAPLVAATLAERGLASEAIEATELIVTNANFGSADPCGDATRQRCEVRLLPLLHRGVVPVITGFIGATQEGLLTTLGRGGSDYSATILGAALDATEVIIWTDVDGVLTADPRLVPDARTIPEISYREAADLAYFGAKVIHPKTLRPLSHEGIPVWIRNTFSPQHPGTKITASDSPTEFGPRAIAAMSDLALITIGISDAHGVPDLLERSASAVSATNTDMLTMSRSSEPDVVHIVVPSANAPVVTNAIKLELATELAQGLVKHIRVNLKVAMITWVGQDMHEGSELAGRTLSAMGREGLDVIAVADGFTGGNLSVVVAEENMTRALNIAHREFRPETLRAQTVTTGFPDGQLATQRNDR
jgi:aspartokinase/homoserine dehydrogenase 1